MVLFSHWHHLVIVAVLFSLIQTSCYIKDMAIRGLPMMKRISGMIKRKSAVIGLKDKG